MYDTYGFPLDLTRMICAEKGISIDEAGFEKCMDRQRAESRKHWKGSGDESLDALYLKLAQDLKAKGKLPQFVGYDQHEARSECLAILVSGEKSLNQVSSYSAPSLAATADSVEKSVMIEAVFAVTPFYGESGGQVGDRGRVTAVGSAGGDATNSFEGEVFDVQRTVPELIVAHIRPKSGC
jgi:alanyl-tRNA synthetase